MKRRQTRALILTGLAATALAALLAYCSGASRTQRVSDAGLNEDVDLGPLSSHLGVGTDTECPLLGLPSNINRPGVQLDCIPRGRGPGSRYAAYHGRDGVDQLSGRRENLMGDGRGGPFLATSNNGAGPASEGPLERTVSNVIQDLLGAGPDGAGGGLGANEPNPFDLPGAPGGGGGGWGGDWGGGYVPSGGGLPLIIAGNQPGLLGGGDGPSGENPGGDGPNNGEDPSQEDPDDETPPMIDPDPPLEDPPTTVVPVPTALPLMITGLLGLFVIARRKRRRR